MGVGKGELIEGIYNDGTGQDRTGQDRTRPRGVT